MKKNSISNDGKKFKNIKTRQNRGRGAINEIMSILQEIYFGKFYFEAAVILRNSLLISRLLFNSEAWYNVTDVEMKMLENIDELLMRKILKAPAKTPKVMLYLELGCVPIREIVRSRRLNFLHYILNQEKTSLIYKFLKAQLKNPTKKDWGTQI